MIPLAVRCHLEGALGDPFVAKLSCSSRTSTHGAEHEATLCAALPDRLVFECNRGKLVIFEVSPDEVDGDVVFVDARRSLCHRWLRANSAHNTLLTTERCDQLCIMCSQPPRSGHTDLFSYFETACLIAERDSIIGFSGGEPMLFREQLLGLIERVAIARPDLQFHVLTNAQHFEPSDVRRISGRAFRKVLWGIPLYSASAQLHDQIVRKHGAYDRLQRSLALLLASGAAIELRTVVLQQNADHLPELARMVGDQLRGVVTWALMQLEAAGFARRAWNGLFFDHSATFQSLADAVTLAEARGVSVCLYNFPLCTVPEAFRRFCAKTISDWKQRYADSCSGCSRRESCCGFFEWHPDPSYGALAPL